MVSIMPGIIIADTIKFPLKPLKLFVLDTIKAYLFNIYLIKDYFNELIPYF